MEIANKAQCDFVLSDAMPLPDIDKPFQAIVKGDQNHYPLRLQVF